MEYRLYPMECSKIGAKAISPYHGHVVCGSSIHASMATEKDRERSLVLIIFCKVLQTVSKEPEQHHARITDVILVFND